MYTGPHIIKDGLVFGYDTGYGIADNVTGTRFYPGKPGTNLVTGQATAFSNWSGLTGTSTYYTTAEGNQGVHLITTSGGGVQFYSSPTITGISASTQYTISATIKYSGTTPHPNLFYVRQYHNGSQITEGGQFSTGLMVDLGNGWYRAYRTFTTTSTTSYINLQGYQYSSGVNLKIQDLQLELGGFLTPYNGVNGTRSSTASLIDLKETTDIDLSNVSFDSTGQPTFDGTSDYIQNSSYTSHQQPTGTLEVVIKPTIVSGNRYVAGVGGTTTYGASRMIRINGGTLGIVTYGSSTQDWSGVTAATVNQYQHVVATWSGTSLQMYVNNVPYSATRTGVVSPLGTNITMGRPPWAAGSYYAGSVDIFKHYNKVLSAAEVQQNYNAYKKRFSI